MSTFQLTGWEDEELNLSLLAVYASWPDYRLAHYLNKTLSLNLCASDKEISYNPVAKGNGFSYYYHEDPNNTFNVYLVVNKRVIKNKGSVLSLFSGEEIETETVFIQSLKKYPFFLLGVDYPVNNRVIRSGNDNINYTHSFDFKSLTKSEQTILNELIYDE